MISTSATTPGGFDEKKRSTEERESSSINRNAAADWIR